MTDMKIVLDNNAIQNINVFQRLTTAHVLDTIENDDTIYFVVRHNDYKFAVGRDGSVIKKCENIFKKRVKVFEFSNDLKTFIKNLIPETNDIIINDNEVKVVVKKYDKPKVIGKEKKNITIIKGFVKRFFGIEDVKII